MMMPLPGIATFLLYFASFRSDSCVRRSILSASSVSLFSIYLIQKSMLSHYYDKKEANAYTLHEKQPSVAIILSSAGGI